jgi:hypothetical protein
MTAILRKNTKGIQVLTDTGWQDFEGVLDKGKRQVAYLQLTYTDIRATLDHEVFTASLTKIAVKNLRPGMQIHTASGLQRVVSVTLANEEQVYDLLNVKNNRRFFANDILVSNCEFIINDETLIAPTKLIDLQGHEPLYKTGQVRWFQTPRPGRTYVVSLDPSLGTGGDPAAIQVFEANTTEQVAEWRHNRTPIPEQVRILADICKHITDTVKDVQNVYFSVENNTIGEAALISISQYGEENIQGYFLSDPNAGAGGSRRYRKGFNTTNKNKLTACSKLKSLVESGKMKIRSPSLVSELKNFVAHGVSYAAKPGETDDLVMATLLNVRMMQLLQTYDTTIDNQLRDHGDAIIAPMPFISVMR